MRGKTALITGAGRGIGKALAFAFASVGANVVCLARTEKEVASVAEDIRNLYHVAASHCVADVTNLESLAMAVDGIVEQFGFIDVLVNNAGITRLAPFDVEDFGTWWSVMETNIRGPAAILHRLLPSMMARNSGTIIAIGSRCCANNMPYSTAYSASKTALLRLHQCLQLELHGRGIKIFVVEPGDVPTTLAHRPGAIAYHTINTNPGFREMLEGTKGICSESPQLCANTCVILAADPRAVCLNGMYIDACQDLEQLIEDLERGPTSKIRQNNLLQLKLDLL